MGYVTRVITVVMGAELVKTIDQQAASKHMTRSEYIRAAIRYYLENDYEKYS